MATWWSTRTATRCGPATPATRPPAAPDRHRPELSRLAFPEGRLDGTIPFAVRAYLKSDGYFHASSTRGGGGHGGERTRLSATAARRLRASGRRGVLRRRHDGQGGRGGRRGHDSL